MARTFTSLTAAEKDIILGMRKKKISYDKIGSAFGITGYTANRWHKWIKTGYKPKQIHHSQKQRSKGRPVKTAKVNFILNPNPPTLLTRILICHYYAEDIDRDKLTHSQAIQDISLELGRTEEYILGVLREELKHERLSLSKAAAERLAVIFGSVML